MVVLAATDAAQRVKLCRAFGWAAYFRTAAGTFPVSQATTVSVHTVNVSSEDEQLFALFGGHKPWLLIVTALKFMLIVRIGCVEQRREMHTSKERIE